jgi:hypothetical protein
MTSVTPGGEFAGFGTGSDGWGDCTEDEAERFNQAIVAKWEELAREATGDDSIWFCVATSEVMFECRGQTDDDGHCLDSATPWACGDERLRDLIREAGEWVIEHMAEFVDD